MLLAKSTKVDMQRLRYNVCGVLQANGNTILTYEENRFSIIMKFEVASLMKLRNCEFCAETQAVTGYQRAAMLAMPLQRPDYRHTATSTDTQHTREREETF